MTGVILCAGAETGVLISLQKMVSDLGVLLLTTVACFQLVLCLSPVSAVADEEDREPPDVLQRWYLRSPSVHTSSDALTRYLIDEGLLSTIYIIIES